MRQDYATGPRGCALVLVDDQRAALASVLLLQEMGFSVDVSVQPDGQPLQPYLVTAAFASLLSSAGLRHVRFHDLRHGVATFLLQQGVAMKVVQDVLGHSTITMTMDRYSHVVPELRHDAAEKVGAVLFG